MQLLLLGADAKTLSILDTLDCGDTTYSVAGWFDSDLVGDQLATRFPQANRIHSADELTNQIADKVLVVGQGGDVDDKESLLRDFARDGVPMLLDQPACTGIFAIELDMIQRDTLAPMIPFHPSSKHAVMGRAAQWARGTSPVGQIEQVVIERSLPKRDDKSVRAALGRDGLLLRRLLGNFQRVGAMPAKENTSLANLSVQLTGESTALGRWSVNPSNEPAGATLYLIGEEGRITIWMPETGDWKLSSTNESLPTENLSNIDDAAYANELVSLLSANPEPTSIPGPRPNWEDAFRATDFADTACESVRRGKTLPISNERLTEEDTFKSLMAAGGCLIILVLPLLLVGVSLFDGMDIPVQRTAQLILLKKERQITLPGDFAALTSLKLTSQGQQFYDKPIELVALSRRELFSEHGNSTNGRPAAYHLSRNDITVAPAADNNYQLELEYQGSFRVWSGWPFLLLLPIAIFLMLQLLKLAFPKPIAKAPPESDNHDALKLVKEPLE